jgi:hypothetical protein
MAPNGTIQDSREYWGSGKPLYDPTRIMVPVLIVHADWDKDCPIEMSRAVFGQLMSAPYRRWVEIGEGTHSVFMEKTVGRYSMRLMAFSARNQKFDLGRIFSEPSIIKLITGSLLSICLGMAVEPARGGYIAPVLHQFGKPDDRS